MSDPTGEQSSCVVSNKGHPEQREIRTAKVCYKLCNDIIIIFYAIKVGGELYDNCTVVLLT